MRFDNQNDAQRQLNDTIIMHDGKAMFVHGVAGDLTIVGEYVLTGDAVRTHQDDPLLSLACPSLGYINAGGNAYYFMRQPIRRWKQGVDTRALVCPYDGIRTRGVLSIRGIAECLEGVYPSLQDGLKLFDTINPFKKENTTEGVAVSKHFAVRKGAKGHLLFFKGREVGVVEDGQPILSTKHHWLAELMESELVC